MDKRVFIGGIHGEEEQLIKLLEELNLNQTDELVFLGDYIDRGKSSKGVLDTLLNISKEYPNARFLWGNHDLMFYEWLTNKNPLYGQTYDGQITLKQFIPSKIHPEVGKVNVIKEYQELFDKMETHVECDEQVAVHGGFNKINKTKSEWGG